MKSPSKELWLGIGAALVEARLTRGLTLADLADETFSRDDMLLRHYRLRWRREIFRYAELPNQSADIEGAFHACEPAALCWIKGLQPQHAREIRRSWRAASRDGDSSLYVAIATAIASILGLSDPLAGAIAGALVTTSAAAMDRWCRATEKEDSQHRG